MATKRVNIYSKVDFKTLKNEILGVMKYLTSEKIDDGLEDEVDWKFNKKGGVSPQIDRKSTRLNSSHIQKSRMPSSA